MRIVRRQRNLCWIKLHGLRGHHLVTLALVQRRNTTTLVHTISHLQITIFIASLAPASTPTPAPRPTTPTLTTTATPLPHKPHRLLQHQEIPLQPLRPILHITQFLELLTSVRDDFRKLVVFLPEADNGLLDVALLLLNSSMV